MRGFGPFWSLYSNISGHSDPNHFVRSAQADAQTGWPDGFVKKLAQNHFFAEINE
jgi:hypothetical protein